MTRDPEWFEKESRELLDKWYHEDTELDYPEYLLKHASKRTRDYYLEERERRRKRYEECLAV